MVDLHFPITITKSQTNNNIWFLREDLLPMACGGNKVRIALKLIQDAVNKHSTVIVAYGNKKSNLCRVLAMMSMMFNLRCVVITPILAERGKENTLNSKIVSVMGAEIIECDKNGKISDCVLNVLSKLKSEGENPYYIYGNEYGVGNEEVLASAYVDVVKEIDLFEKSSNIKFDMIVCAVGTGSTYAGLLNGLKKHNLQKEVVGYTIARSLESAVNSVDKYGVNTNSTNISDAALCGGYGEISTELLVFVKKMWEKEGIFFDPVYSGKALWGFCKIHESCCLNKNVLFIHTGSQPLAFDLLLNQ